MMHASHIHVRTLNNPNQPVQVQAQVQVDPGTSGAGDESETTTDTSDYKSFASSSSSSSRTSSPASSTSTTIHTTQGPEYSLLSDRDCTQDRDFSDLGFGTPIVSPGSPHAQQPRRLSTSSSRGSSWRGQNQDQPLDSHLPTQVSALSPTTAARDHDRDLDDSTMSLSSRPIDTEFAAPNSPPIKNTTNTLPHSPADSAPTTSQSPPPPSMATYTMPAGPTTGAQPPGIASLFPSALGLMTGAASDWSAQQHQQQQQQPASSYYYPSQQQQLPILRPPKVYGPLGTYEQLLDNVLSAAWSVAASVWAMLKTAGSWVVTPVKNVGWYYAGMVADTAALYWRASPHLRVFVYAFGLITAIPLAIFAGYAAVTLGITLAVASGGTLLASGAALGGGMLVLGPILLFSLIGAGLLTLAVSVLSGGWHALFGGGEPQPQMMVASGGGAYVQQQPQQQQQGQGLIGSILGWLAPSSAAPPVAGSGYYGADAGMLKQPPGTYAGAAGMQMPMQQQQEPNVLAR